MSFVATLISAPDTSSITDAVLAEARRVLRTGHQPRTLHAEVAAEVIFDDLDPGEASRALRASFEGLPIDFAVQPTAHRRKRLLLADMDSTLIGQECIDELADYAGLKTEVAGITERAMRGEIAFEPALRERVALLREVPVRAVDEIIRDRITLTPGGRELVATMRAHGAFTCLVSGGFTHFTGPIAGQLGFDEARANRLVITAERFAGSVEEPILGREAKLATLVELRDRLGLAQEETIAVGDGANDLAMIGEAGVGVAFHAKPAVAAAAGVRIDHGDLTALLYVQGYAASEFARS